MSRATLATIDLRKGEIRGLSDFEICFTYPLSVIAGTNGSGKSTILALASCAYHNRSDGFRLPGRKLAYYTMSDFFVQSSEEIPPEGINIWYEFLHNNWRKFSRLPTGVGRAWQSRSKRKGGKWSNYSRRVNRNVLFFGIERVVPHSERTVSKSYRYCFAKVEADGYEEDVRRVVGKILGNRYDQFWFTKHSKYRLPHVATKDTIYSGFNMGAGENALFEIFSTIYACPHGVLLVIDEIELGLHESAQRRLMDVFKEVCQERHIQVICTTHSATILDCVPPEGRLFVDRRGRRTVITTGISSMYAAGRLAGENSNELDLYVEDGVSQSLVEALLPSGTRRRVNLLPIGSPSAIVRQLAARYKGRETGECLAIMDGDQRGFVKAHKRNFINALETDTRKDERLSWFEKRVTFLPGDTWPEFWMLTQLTSLNTETIANTFRISPDEFQDHCRCEEALAAGKHNELFTLAKNLSLPVQEASWAVCRWITEHKEEHFREIISAIENMLD